MHTGTMPSPVHVFINIPVINNQSYPNMHHFMSVTVPDSCYGSCCEKNTIPKHIHKMWKTKKNQCNVGQWELLRMAFNHWKCDTSLAIVHCCSTRSLLHELKGGFCLLFGHSRWLITATVNT